jgi:hypothetical protein
MNNIIIKSAININILTPGLNKILAHPIFPIYNEPFGFTTISERSWNVIATWPTDPSAENGWDSIEGKSDIVSPNPNTLTIFSDPTAPISPSNVAQIMYPSGAAGGGSFTVAQRKWSVNLRYNQLYIRYYLKVSSNFEGHSTTTNKIFHYWITGNSGSDPDGGNRVFDRIVGSGSDSILDFQIGLQGVPDTRSQLTGSIGTCTFNRDQWYQIENLFIANSPGVANGIVRTWINGVKVIDYNNVEILSGSDIAPAWVEAQWSPTWGGGGGHLTKTCYMWMDHTYISAKI